MNKRDADLDRLLRSAAEASKRGREDEMPYGFDTRVVALSREADTRPANGSAEITRFVRRIAAVAFAIFAVASAGAYQQFAVAPDAGADGDETPLSEAYAIADTAIQTEVPELAQ